MSIRVQDPLFLLSAQSGLSVGELQADAADAVPDVNKPQEALKTGEPIPILFARFRNGTGGVMAQPKITEGYFANPIVEEEYDYGSSSIKVVFQTFQVKYLFVLSEGELPLVQIRDIFFGPCRVGTFNQKYNGRAGTWNPGNAIDDHFTDIISSPTNGVYYYNPFNLSQGQSAKLGNTVYYKSSFALHIQPYVEREGYATFCGTSGTYSGLTTLSFEYQTNATSVDKSLSIFVRNGLQVTRLVDDVTGESDNFVDLAKYLFQAGNRLADDLIDDAALTIAAKFADANGFLFNGVISKSQNLLDWLQATSVNFLLRLSNSGGKFGLLPRLPYNTDFTIKTTQVTPEFTFTEEHVVPGGFEVEYISLEDREPVCFVVQWRQQPEADFGLVRTLQVRYAGEADNGPFVSIDMSNYCVSENHAAKVGAFRLAQRKFITHHLRLTVRESSYNSTLVIGDLVRVRLRRETSEGDAEYHDKLYEINRIEKSFASVIVYDLTHFPIDSQGRSIIAREVDAAVGAGNVIEVGRSAFDCDVNSSSSTTTVGSSSGGGGNDQPPANDTELDLDQPDAEDSPYPDGENNPDDSLDQTLDGNEIEGYTGNPANGDTLTYDPGCPNAFTEWYSVDKATGARTLLGSGVGATLDVVTSMLLQGAHVIAIGRCPDSSSPDGYGAPITSNEVDWLPDCIANVNGCQQVDGTGTLQIKYDGSNGWVVPFFGSHPRAYATANAIKIKSTLVFFGQQTNRWIVYVVWDFLTQNDEIGTTSSTDIRFQTEAEAESVQFRINPDSNSSCISDCTI